MSSRPLILLVDNYDSFTTNLEHALHRAGANVLRKTWRVLSPELSDELGGVVVGPGPGNVNEMPELQEFVQALLDAQIPTLGVCLGHQILALLMGGQVERSNVLGHGRTRLVSHDGKGIFATLKSPTSMMFYNSLTATLDQRFVSARDQFGHVAAIRRSGFSGVQFHPESFLSTDGQELLNNWLHDIAGNRGG